MLGRVISAVNMIQENVRDWVTFNLSVLEVISHLGIIIDQ